ncbi:REP element-mobilizing transposase RayT [Pseudomonas taetrolens]|uniref:Transposase n=1 Tax=Pseudomonas taetrolens TaxID=47884 RepID=A0A0J6GQ59_PSETA|nr:transposase [Pseudomonas taetrolens]KMM84533.1 transposase [Pseudomonas taetrolens]SEB53725.1 REP element-mobilizing transposase RayT [Pseudomonas taetrolens]SQF84766.1 transposase [Pseudomonas taetrolens]VEH46452.1 transposase [Pseudomonas taetrolens]
MPTSKNAYRLRIGRHSEFGRLYLLTTITQQRRPIFNNFQLGRLVVDQFRQAHEDGIVISKAWVVMPDHFHWLIELQNKTLGELMCRIKSRSSVNINRLTKTHERVWRKGYYDRVLRQEDDVKAAARYIIQNPIRAQLATRIGDYPLWDACWI